MEKEKSMKTQRPTIAKTTLKKKYQVGRWSLSDFDLLCKQSSQDTTTTKTDKTDHK